MHRPRLHTALLLLALAPLVGGCISITRVESDLYTITERDTTIRESVRNAPGERDNGTIYPSPRVVEIERRYIQRDSVVNRYYPSFMRAGGIEAASFFAPGSSEEGSGNGLFGLYRLLSLKSPDSAKTFGANMYRLMPYEWRLRIFDDDPNWTIGTAAWERFMYQKDEFAELDPGEKLDGVFPLYVRRRFYLRDRPPYIMAVPFFGIGFFPSAYVNLGATFDVGSVGGFNLRAYAGYVAGTDYSRAEANDRENYDLGFPYFGLGVSALDFVNAAPELKVEWKDHAHTAVEVSGVEVSLVTSTSQNAGSFFNRNARDSTTQFPSGFILKVASANVPLPFADDNFFVGTTLFNLFALSRNEIAFGWLPIRAGYRRELLGKDLNVQGYAEYTYYPATAIHIGAKASLTIYEWVTLSAMAGFVDGSANLDLVSGYEDLKAFGNFSTFYLGVGIGAGHVFNAVDRVKEVWQK